jgi:hypothetical protein
VLVSHSLATPKPSLFSLVFCICTSPSNNFFLRETRDGLKAFSGADRSRARFLKRSSKTLDREHRWKNAGLQRRGLSGEKNGKNNVFG